MVVVSIWVSHLKVSDYPAMGRKERERALPGDNELRL